jgi:hypothetical protein
MTRLVIDKCIAAGVGETRDPRGKPTNKPLSLVSSAGADKFSTSTVEKPVRVDISVSDIKEILQQTRLHASELGTGQYFILLLTRVLEGNCCTGKACPHSRVICLSII